MCWFEEKIKQEDYGLLKIELSHTKTLLASCEKALEERDKKQNIMYSEEEVRHLLIECCGEVSCEDGALLGKTPDDLANWIDIKLKNK